MIKEEGENLGQKKHSENVEVMRMQTEITWPENRQARTLCGRSFRKAPFGKADQPCPFTAYDSADLRDL